jgi:hypothetical protein
MGHFFVAGAKERQTERKKKDGHDESCPYKLAVAEVLDVAVGAEADVVSQ